MNHAARVFISYRRSDTKWAAGRLYDRLAAVLGSESVFLDVTNIEPGKDFIQAIEEVIATCDIVLAIIGKEWLRSTDEGGNARIENTRDLIRVEIATALRRDIRVIPILIDGAILPQEQELPAELAGLARRNARQVYFETFHSDLDSFIRVLERILAGPTAPPRTVAQAAREAGDQGSAFVATALPFTISLETLGGIASPLITKGSALPAEASEVFSTAADNQTSVQIRLFAGERKQSQENLPLGTFQLIDIPVAPRGVPQIRLSATVDPSLILVVAAEDLGTGKKEVLDAVDLSKLQIPPLAMRVEPEDKPGTKSSDIFEDSFEGHRVTPPTGNSADKPSLDTELTLRITKAEAESGGERAVTAPQGKVLRVKIPNGVESGTKLRLRGQGRENGGKKGDLYIVLTVS